MKEKKLYLFIYFNMTTAWS